MDSEAHSLGDRDSGLSDTLTSTDEPLNAFLDAPNGISGERSDVPNNTQYDAADPSSIIQTSQGAGVKEKDAGNDIAKTKSNEIGSTSSDMSELKDLLPKLPSDATFKEIWRMNDEFAKATGTFVVNLEARVGALEDSVRELEKHTGQRVKEEGAE